jgi:hypothetical protein
MLFQRGIAIDEGADDDLYAMLVPGESDMNIKIVKKDKKQPNNIRSPFQENFPYDNIY